MKNLSGAFAGTDTVVVICIWGLIDIFFGGRERKIDSAKKRNIPLIHTFISTYILLVSTKRRNDLKPPTTTFRIRFFIIFVTVLLKEKVTPKSVFFLSSPIKSLY